MRNNTILTTQRLRLRTWRARDARDYHRHCYTEKVIANIRFWADGHRPPDQVLEGWS